VKFVLIVVLLFDEMQEPYLITKLESAEKTWKDLSVCFGKKNVISLNKLFHRVYVGCVLRQIILAELICCHCTYKKKLLSL
jgi:hypothetical protein